MPKTTKAKQPDSADRPNINPICPVECAHCGAWMERISGKKDSLWTCDCGGQIAEDILLRRVSKLLYDLIDDISMVGTVIPLNLSPIATMQAPLAGPDMSLDYFEFDRVKVKNLLLDISDCAHALKDIQDSDLKVKTEKEYTLAANAMAQHLSVIFCVTVDRIQATDGLFRIILKNEQKLGFDDNGRDPAIEEKIRLCHETVITERNI